jgi:hypothetical protein
MRTGDKGVRAAINIKSLVENCILAATAYLQGHVVFQDCLWVMGGPFAQNEWNTNPCEFRLCTILHPVSLRGQNNVLIDSIVASVAGGGLEGTRIENCNMLGANPPLHGQNCFRADPEFSNPLNLDFRLMPTSPCRGKASDGGDIGCRYTPEMIETCKKALELRQQGIIKFKLWSAVIHRRF